MTSTRECIKLFRSGVERVLTNWTALKLAVEHGTGGPNSQTLADNFVDYIADIFCEDGANIELEDISETLVEVMDTQFQTWCEDDSPNEIARVLWNLFQLCKTGNIDGLRIEIDKLPLCSYQLPESKNLQVEKLKRLQQSEETAPALQTLLEESSGDQEMEEDPGWTHVGPRRKCVN